MAGGAAMMADAGHELASRATEARSVGELFAAASACLRPLVPFDAAVWLATDPATGLPTAPTRSEDMGDFDAGACRLGWELEFTVEDVNRWSALARAPVPAGGLRIATADRPARSTRYRALLGVRGLIDELRGVMRADGDPWALVALFRREGRPSFDARERDVVAALSEPLGAAVRERARPEFGARGPAAAHGPGLMVFAPDGELLSVNDDALAWLDELAGGAEEDGDAFSVPLPMAVISTLMRARAIADERESGSARVRIRSRASGRWVVCHASCLLDADGRAGDTALVIDAAAGSEIAPIVARAYELSRREREITGLIARGLGTTEIAKRLHLSAHTVRDYVKTTLEKVGVSSRGQLVAKLFAEHHAPLHLDPGQVEHVAA